MDVLWSNSFRVGFFSKGQEIIFRNFLKVFKWLLLTLKYVFSKDKNNFSWKYKVSYRNKDVHTILFKFGFRFGWKMSRFFPPSLSTNSLRLTLCETGKLVIFFHQISYYTFWHSRRFQITKITGVIDSHQKIIFKNSWDYPTLFTKLSRKVILLFGKLQRDFERSTNY